MRRSEMIRDLDSYMSLRGLDPYPEDAKRILDFLEEKGMLPPIEPGRTEHDLDLGVPQWEPENE